MLSDLRYGSGVGGNGVRERNLAPALSEVLLFVIEGFAVGGGLAIAAACDLRIATPGSRFGVPIARTLGNCLSMANYARLLAAVRLGRIRPRADLRPEFASPPQRSNGTAPAHRSQTARPSDRLPMARCQRPVSRLGAGRQAPGRELSAPLGGDWARKGRTVDLRGCGRPTQCKEGDLAC